MSVETHNSSSQETIQAYLDDLLNDAAETELPEAASIDETAVSSVSHYYAFAIQGLQLLIPETAIACIDEAPAAMTSPCDGDWLAGYSQTDAGLLPIVDAPKLLGLSTSALVEGQPAVMVCLNSNAGLIAVPATGNMTAIEPTEVTWRGNEGRRPWLAGTLAASRSVLLDVDGLCSMLATAGSYQ